MRYVSDYGAFEVSPTPGQPQLAHCHGFFIVPSGRGKGLGTSQKEAQMKVLTDELFDYATCTVDSNNTAQKRVLAKTGWKLLDTFDNSRTGGKTELWGWDVGGDDYTGDTSSKQESSPRELLLDAIKTVARLMPKMVSIKFVAHQDDHVTFRLETSCRNSFYVPLPIPFRAPLPGLEADLTSLMEAVMVGVLDTDHPANKAPMPVIPQPQPGRRDQVPAAISYPTGSLGESIDDQAWQ